MPKTSTPSPKRSVSSRKGAILAACHDDPVGFHKAVLGRQLWSRQEEIAASVARYYVTVVYSGNAVGKDYLVGGIVPWWLWTRPEALCVVTAPGQRTIGSVTWKEVRRAVKGSRVKLACKISSAIGANPQILQIGDRAALGYSATTVERASGQHARHLLAIVEEASGLDDESWDAVEGLKYEKLLAIGNPIRPDGRFVDLIRQAERDRQDGIPPHRAVNAIRIPSTDSPHADLETSPWGLADRTWLDAMKRRYGLGLWYRSHVLAEIPAVSEDRLIPDSWLDFASATPRHGRVDDPRLVSTRRIAIDLGEGVGRDATAIIVRDQLGILEVFHSPTAGLAEASTVVQRLSMKWAVPHARISYDKGGIGRDFGRNHLVRVGIAEALPYSGSGRCKSRHYTNLRTEAAWNLRNRLDPEWQPDPRTAKTQAPFQIVPGSYWERLRTDLEALTYDLVGSQTRLVSKEDLCDRLGRSPDLGDALIQSFAF